MNFSLKYISSHFISKYYVAVKWRDIIYNRFAYLIQKHLKVKRKFYCFFSVIIYVIENIKYRLKCFFKS